MTTRTKPTLQRRIALVAVGLCTATAATIGGTLTASASDFVGVPDSYDYKPNTSKNKTLHDYCSYSPDEFPAPAAKNARFQGPCARHDMCIGKGDVKRSSCDAALKRDMDTNCKHYYGKINPLRYACMETATTYWKVVRAKTFIS